MYCKQCASKLIEDAKFCSICGAMVKPKGSMNKLIIGVGCSLLTVAVIVSMVIGFIFIQNVNSPDNMIDKFFTAMRSNDFELIKELLVVDEESSQSEEEYINYLLEYYNENRPALVTDLNELKQDYLLGKFTTLPYYITKEENNYFIKIIPRALNVDTSYETTEMRCFLGDEKIDNFDFLLPGKYKLEVDYLYDSEKRTLEYEVDLFNDGPIMSVDLDEILE